MNIVKSLLFVICSIASVQLAMMLPVASMGDILMGLDYCSKSSIWPVFFLFFFFFLVCQKNRAVGFYLSVLILAASALSIVTSLSYGSFGHLAFIVLSAVVPIVVLNIKPTIPKFGWSLSISIVVFLAFFVGFCQSSRYDGFFY